MNKAYPQLRFSYSHAECYDRFRSGWCLLGRIAACLVQPMQSTARLAAMGGFAKSAGAVRTENY